METLKTQNIVEEKSEDVNVGDVKSVENKTQK